MSELVSSVFTWPGRVIDAKRELGSCRPTRPRPRAAASDADTTIRAETVSRFTVGA